ncbi:RNA polymerase sigma factor [Nocardioides jensenii]|uniref:RNA polymerase sigma factor n=1 Tax=Nocardioides jensenii TaxID=1843 RepID=UPI00082E6091|nr:RNA polymerase sigma factor [Nocardioides jensenii]
MSSAEDELEAALGRMLDGDDDGFRFVYRSVQPALLRYLGVLVGLDEAEDIASESWAQAVRDLRKFHGRIDGFRGWITTIARNRALDHLRSQGRRPAISAPNEDLPEPRPGGDADHGAMEAMSTDAALHLIRQLPREQAEAVMLRAVMGLDARTAGEVLGRRAGAVRTAAHRGLKTLRDLLTETPSNTFESPDADGVR